MPKIFITLIVSMCLANIQVMASEVKALKRFDRLFDVKLIEAEIPGGAYAIVKNGKTLQVGTFGHRSLREMKSVNIETVFRLASVSKTFAATLTAKLAEDNILLLTDRIAPYNPRLRLRHQSRLDELTLTHALSHTSGLMPNAYDNMLEDGWQLPKILPRFNRVKTTCGVGQCYGYQNIIFSLIEPVIEAKTGTSYTDLMQAELFKPLGMHQASIGLKAYQNSRNKALPHQPTRRGMRQVKVNEHYYRIAPAAGVNASIADMAIWMNAHLGHSDHVISGSVLANLRDKRVETKREMYKPLWKPHLKNAHYGLGWRVYNFRGVELIAHGGAVAGFRSVVSYNVDRDLGLAILMNANANVIDELTIDFWRSVVDLNALGQKVDLAMKAP